MNLGRVWKIRFFRETLFSSAVRGVAEGSDNLPICYLSSMTVNINIKKYRSNILQSLY